MRLQRWDDIGDGVASGFNRGDPEMEAHWKNPWEDAVIVPLEKLAEILGDGTRIRIIDKDGHERVGIQTKEAVIEHFRSYGDKLDAYVLEPRDPSGYVSVGVRYGADGEMYLSPYCSRPDLAKNLYEEYRNR